MADNLSVIERLEPRTLFSTAGGPVQDFSPTGQNLYFILEPGVRLQLEGEEDGEPVRVVIRVLNKTKVIDGVTTRVVRERELIGGELVEVSDNYFAIDRNTNDVYYFGEDVNIYEDGEIVSHEGAWRSGVDGATFGLFMPGDPRVGQTFLQENAPGVALDTGEIISKRSVAHTPDGTFRFALRVRETSPLEPGAVGFKRYAPGIGLVQDGELRLVSHS